jgi:peptidoglycan/LPS O-acetylase OafA/YrhL
MILIVAVLGQLSIDESSWSQRIFRQSSVRYIGKISYSLYLWQQLFLVTKQPRWGILRHLPVSMLIPFALAMLSYRFFEGPILRIKDRVCSHGWHHR